MLFQVLGFIVGFLIAAASFRETLWIPGARTVAWSYCVFSGLVVAGLELAVSLST